MAVLNEYTQVTIFWFPAFGNNDATRSVMSKFDIYISRISYVIYYPVVYRTSA